ncbi:MAG: transketolase C-terminal domain-containing protein [Verrucomicrobiae bacterium]|nr:transketolase C-terminal domain-containing protein [Verrucomicrobiae bacterium]
MRNAFAQVITELAATCPEVVLLSGDIGNRLFDRFKAAHPARFYNGGVAEANLVGVASGLAMNGFRPFVYTIASFITYRVVEQIRLDCAYHHQPVTLVGTGAGLSYASLGATHHTLEDIGMLRCIPSLKILCPGDAVELRSLLPLILAQPDPVYLRIGKKGEPVVHQKKNLALEIGRALPVREGRDAVILTTGNMLPVGVETAGILTARGISTGALSFHTVKPLDEQTLADCFASHRGVFTLEEHSVVGGFGTAVAEWLGEHPSPKAVFRRFGSPDAFIHEATEQDHARKRFGLTPPQLAEQIEKILAKS